MNITDISCSFIDTIDLHTFQQNFNVSNENKIIYGEVNTPFSLIQDMISLIPSHILENPHLKWLDPACGCGYFAMVIYKVLMNSLQNIIKCREKRKQHILSKMIFMVEINPSNYCILRKMFGPNANIYNCDFLTFGKDYVFDIIIGNPPYNCNGAIKVPTNTQLHKKVDGTTIWTDFVKHSCSLLQPHGYLVMIIPSIWMKPDKLRMYHFITQFKIHKLRAFTSTETNQLFKHKAQTPTCYFILEKMSNDLFVSLYNTFTRVYEPYKYNIGEPIPLCGSSIISKIKQFCYLGTFNIKKTNMPRKHIRISSHKTNEFSYNNIKTCILTGKKKDIPQLIYEYSNVPCIFYGEKKLILAHKMYGFPFYDREGMYGISNRDTYVIHGYTDDEFKRIQSFLSTQTARFLFESTRYRMKYLEKYIFQLIPDITKIQGFPKIINDTTIFEFFQFTQTEITQILSLHRKIYEDFIQ